MASSWGDSISMAKARGCWRLCHVQTSGCMAAERQTAAQAEHQQVVLDYVADGGCDVVGLGGTRLGNDAAAKMNRMACVSLLHTLQPAWRWERQLARRGKAARQRRKTSRWCSALL